MNAQIKITRNNKKIYTFQIKLIEKDNVQRFWDAVYEIEDWVEEESYECRDWNAYQNGIVYFSDGIAAHFSIN